MTWLRANPRLEGFVPSFFSVLAGESETPVGVEIYLLSYRDNPSYRGAAKTKAETTSQPLE